MPFHMAKCHGELGASMFQPHLDVLYGPHVVTMQVAWLVPCTHAGMALGPQVMPSE